MSVTLIMFLEFKMAPDSRPTQRSGDSNDVLSVKRKKNDKNFKKKKNYFTLLWMVVCTLLTEACLVVVLSFYSLMPQSFYGFISANVHYY